MILLAVLTSPHGIKGALKVKTFTEESVNILKYGALQDEKGRTYDLKLVRATSFNSLIVTVKGITTRTQAEALQGTKLYIDRNQLPDLNTEEFYHEDLIGLGVQDLEGASLGHIKAVHNFNAGDFLEIVDDEHHVYTIPFTQEAVPVVQVVSLKTSGEKLSDSKAEDKGVVTVDSVFLMDSRQICQKQGEQKTFSETSENLGKENYAQQKYGRNKKKDLRKKED